MLGGAEAPEFDHAASVLYFEVADIEAEYAAMKERGVKFRDAPHLIHKDRGKALWMAFFDDSEGNTFALMSMRAA